MLIYLLFISLIVLWQLLGMELAGNQPSRALHLARAKL